MRTENQILASVIEKCFEYSMDGRFTQDRRSEFLVLGKRLRGSLVNLVTANFKEDTAELNNANKKLKDVNDKLKKEIETLNNVADTVEQIGQLVGILDDLLKLAGGFI